MLTKRWFRFWIGWCLFFLVFDAAFGLWFWAAIMTVEGAVFTTMYNQWLKRQEK